MFLCPDILVLDEPTNHLDGSSVEYLMEYLQSYTNTVVIISHDIEFLDNIVDNVIYINDKTLTQSSGPVATFINNMSSLHKPIKFPVPKSIKNPLVQLRNLSFKYPNSIPLFSNVDFTINNNSRIAIMGPNGVGKTTLVKLISGEIDLSGDDSDMIYRNINLTIGRLHQQINLELYSSQTAVQSLINLAYEHYSSNCRDWINEHNIRKHLGRFGITQSSQLQQVSELSDGQRSRLMLALASLIEPQMLILNEPTNYLDPIMIEVMTQGLIEYIGALIIISHNETLIRRTCDQKEHSSFRHLICQIIRIESGDIKVEFIN